MEDIQEKLESYRVRKRRKERFDQIKKSVQSFLWLGTGRSEMNEKDDTTITIPLKQDVEELVDTNELLNTDEENESTSDLGESIDDNSNENKFLKYTLWIVWFLFWLTLYIIAIELKFGIVYLMFSALFGIYFNTRTQPKKPNEISAYSVFNKNCESIDGTLKAEQFEREMRYGAGSVR